MLCPVRKGVVAKVQGGGSVSSCRSCACKDGCNNKYEPAQQEWEVWLTQKKKEGQHFGAAHSLGGKASSQRGRRSWYVAQHHQAKTMERGGTQVNEDVV